MTTGNTAINRFSLLRMLTVVWLMLSGSIQAAAPGDEFRSVIETDPAVHERFALLLQESQPRVDQVSEGVFLARGFGQGSAVLVEGQHSALVFDVGDSYEHARAMLDALEPLASKPIRYIVYSHYHFDHVFGGQAWVEAAADDVQIVAHERTVRYLDERVSALAPRTDWGLAMQFGMHLDERCTVGEGPLCSGVMGIQFPRIGSTKGHRRHVVYPNRLVKDRLRLDLGELEVELIHAPSETPDNLVLWIPDRATVLTGDALTPTLPPLFTARGQRVRDPEEWIVAIDLMRSLKPQHVVPSHGPAFSGELATKVLSNYRDAIAFMYHQTVRLINRGHGPEEIASELTLPVHLHDNPYLGQWYNDFQTNIRGIYGYLVGHYHDVAELALLPPADEARAMVALAGGEEAYLHRLREAYDRGEFTWVARASSHLIRQKPGNSEVKKLKAAALRVMAARSVAGSQRHFYLQHAAALEGLIEIPISARVSEDDLSTVPIETLIRQLPFRLDAQAAAGRGDRFTLEITDSATRYTIELRRGVAEVVEAVQSDRSQLSASSRDFRRFFTGELELEAGFSEKKFAGDVSATTAFFRLFDWPGAVAPGHQASK